MGKWSRAEYDRTLVGKLEQLYQNCRETSPHPIVDDRFRTFVRTLDVNDKAVQACFSNLIQHVHRKQLATSSTYTVDHPIFDALTNVDPPSASPGFDRVNWGVDPMDFWVPHERNEADDHGARSPTPMPTRSTEVVRPPNDWLFGDNVNEDFTTTAHDEPLPAIPAVGSPTLSQPGGARDPPASASPQPLSASQAWLEEYYRTRQRVPVNPFPDYPYSVYPHDALPPPSRRRQRYAVPEDDEEDGLRRRRRRLDDVVDPAIRGPTGSRMERDRRRDGVVFSAFTPDVERSAGGVRYRAARTPPTPPRPLM